VPSDVFHFAGTIIREQYRVDQVIGEGGFGVVYRGLHLGFEHPIAIKCLKVPEHFTQEARQLFFERFREEGKILSKLSVHPNVVRVFDCGVCSGPSEIRVPFLILEWLEGQDLEAIMAQRSVPFTESEALTLIRPVVDALALAHKLGIAHRDIKPANVFVVPSPRGTMAKVLDFGIAKAMQEGESATQLVTHTSSGFSSFSPSYGAPEQFRPKKFGPTGPWTDVHAIGLLLTEMVSHRTAYPGDSMEEFFDAATAEQRPSPRRLNVLVSDTFESMVTSALALLPTSRPCDAEKLLLMMADLGDGSERAGVSPNQTPLPSPNPSPGAVTREMAEPPAFLGKSQRLEGSSTDNKLSSTATGAVIAPPSVPEKTTHPSLWKLAQSVTGMSIIAALVFVLYRCNTTPDHPKHSTSNVTSLGMISGSAFPDSLGVGTKPDPTSSRDGTAMNQPSNAKNVGSMVRIPEGSFFMGSETGAQNEKPKHQIHLASYEMDRTEVTVLQYRECVLSGVCQIGDGVNDEWYETNGGLDKWTELGCNYGRTDRNLHPMNCVDWNNARAYCQWVNKRLPTEEEWEYAARDTEGRQYAWGDEVPDNHRVNACGAECASWYKKEFHIDSQKLHDGDDGWPATAPVGSFPLGNTPLGLADMTGNVWEWLESGYSENYDAVRDEARRVNRGGAWDDTSVHGLRATIRSWGVPTDREPDLGFRCAR
jgi:eukaryotic-like serine/threonine-protein kinase